MSLRCKHEDCDPQVTQCLLGDSIATCKNIRRNGKAEDEQPIPSGQELFETVAWSGNTLGTKNLHLVAARCSPLLIGIIGPHDSGKTTYLGLLFRRLLNGDQIGGFGFAGSYTLRAWESISKGFRWPQKGGLGFRFPAHTSLNEKSRVPGLLHLALRDAGGRLRDVLFTDAPGEWFTDWANNKVNESAAGARWIHQHASGFLVFADSKRLEGEYRGRACEELERIVQRTGSDLGSRPIALAWSKADIAVPEPIRQRVLKAIKRLNNDQKVFQISYEERFLSCYTDSVTWILEQILDQAAVAIPTPRSQQVDFFFQIR